MSEPPFPYIVGVERSGTTLTRAMLTSHPDLDITEEAPFRVDMSLKHERYEHPHGVDIEAFVSDLCRDRFFSYWGLSEDEVRRLLSEAAPPTYSDAMRAVFRHRARVVGKTRYGDKTPSAVNFLPLLAHLFPEARFIHVIRDGRDVALSQVNVDSGRRSVGDVALEWKAQIERGQRDGGILGPQRYREVRYEELVDDPGRVVRSLCEFVELAFDPRMLTYYERAEAIVGLPETAPFDRNIYLPPTKGLRDWRHQMRRGDLEIFETIAGNLLQRLGYERAVPSVTVRMRRRADVVRALAAAKRTARYVLKRGHRKILNG
jgi:Sulfotransferase family